LIQEAAQKSRAKYRDAFLSHLLPADSTGHASIDPLAIVKLDKTRVFVIKGGSSLTHKSHCYVPIEETYRSGEYPKHCELQASSILKVKE